MKTTSPPEEVKRYDILIIASYLLLSVSFFFEREYHMISIIAGLLFAFLFSKCIRTTGESSRNIRLKSVAYAFSFMVAFTCALKITECLRDKILEVDALGVVLTGVCLQSIYFLVVKNKCTQRERS